MRRRSLLMAMCLSSVLLGSVQSGIEAATLCAGAGFLFDGVAQAPTDPTTYGVHRATATIRDRVGDVCQGSDTGDSSIWIMVAGVTPLEYAQVGYANHGGWTSPRGFVQANSGECGLEGGACNVYTFTDLVFTGSQNWWSFTQGTHDYDVKAVTYGSEYRMKMYVDGNYVGMSNFDPHLEWGHPGWSAQYMGETHDQGDDVAGSATAKTNFTNMKYANCVGCSLLGINGAVPANDQPGVYYQDSPGIGVCSTCMNLWTDRPPIPGH